jgi:hypothetical protein
MKSIRSELEKNIDFRCPGCPALLESELGTEDNVDYFERPCSRGFISPFGEDDDGCRKGLPAIGAVVLIDGVEYLQLRED